MVEPASGTAKRFFLASSIPFWMAAGTSLAFPYPRPTLPAASPTTTSAVNENRRPPFTTLATRLMAITRSSYCPSGTVISALSGGSDAEQGRIPALSRCASQFQSCFACAVGDCRNPAVIPEAAAVEHHGGDSGCLGAVADELADVPGRIDGRGRARAQLALRCRRARDGATCEVVDDLHVDVLVRPEHCQARTFGRPHDLLADTAVAPRAVFRFGQCHNSTCLFRLVWVDSTLRSPPVASLSSPFVWVDSTLRSPPVTSLSSPFVWVDSTLRSPPVTSLSSPYF